MKKRKQKVDPRYIGVPNICFSLTDEKDEREKEFAKQRKTRGFDNSETWALYESIAKFTLPRLKCFRQITCGYPMEFDSDEPWNTILDQMIQAFELICEVGYTADDKKDRIIRRGLNLFHKYFFALWY